MLVWFWLMFGFICLVLFFVFCIISFREKTRENRQERAQVIDATKNVTIGSDIKE